MAELTGRLRYNVSFTEKGNPIITLELNERVPALKMVDELHDAEKLTINIGKFKQKRSLDANAYFHVLVNMIARNQNLSDNEVKRRLVKDYGTLARDDNGELVGAMLPADANIDRFYPYTRNYKTEYRDGKEYSCYLFYKRTRELTSSEMAKLIEGTINEAKQLGIETRSPDEIARMLSLYKEQSPYEE